MKQRATLFGVLGLVFALIITLLVWRPWNTAPETAANQPDQAGEEAPDAGSKDGTGGDPVERVTETKRRVSKEERERYRQAIRDAPARRERLRDAEAPPPPDLPGQDAVDDDPAAPPSGGGGLTDRSDGKLADLMQNLQEDVMPLAEECYSLARDNDPELEGGLDLQFQIVGDEDVGGMVDAVDLLESSEIQNEELIECMRETLFSTIFPAPDDSGSTGVELTLEFAPEDPG